MADSFHFLVNIISRGKGKSAVASAAYISGEKIKNEWDGVTHDYTKKQGVISKEIFLPDHAPEEYKDRKTLWNSVELFEKNSNAQLARNFIISLPKELSIEENKKMIEEFVAIFVFTNLSMFQVAFCFANITMCILIDKEFV